MGSIASKSDKNNSSETPNQLKKKTILNNLELHDPRSPNALITRTPIFVSIVLVHSLFVVYFIFSYDNFTIIGIGKFSSAHFETSKSNK